MTVAITTQLAAANGGIEAWCGVTMEVTSADGVVTLTINDDNATGGSYFNDDYVLDVTPAAFDILSSDNGGTNSPTGEVTVSWEITGTTNCL